VSDLEPSNEDEESPLHEGDDQANANSRWGEFVSRWGWPLFGLLAVVAFELTANLMFSVLLFSTRFGWKDAYAGWYAWRVDPRPARGRVLGLAHLVSAMNRIALPGIVLGSWLRMMMDNFFPRNGQNVVATVVEVNEVLIVASVLCVMLMLLTFSLAWWTRVKIWIDLKSYEDALSGEWPPRKFFLNRCRMIWLYSICPFLSFGYWWYVLRSFQNWNLMQVNSYFAVSVLVYLFIYWRFERTVFAKYPVDCWPELWVRSHTTDSV
jgi:hypothetical protein